MKLEPLPWQLEPPFDRMATPKMFWVCGLCCLFVYAACKVAFPGIGYIFERLSALLGLVGLFWYGHQLRRDLVLWFLVAALFVPLLSWSAGQWHHPDLLEGNPELDRTGKLFLFVPVAFLLAGSTRNTLMLWATAAVFFFVAVLIHGNGLHDWIVGLQGERVHFGIRGWQHPSMFFGIVFLGLIGLSGRIVQRHRFLHWHTFVWLAALAITGVGIVITQTRAVWIGLLVALVCMGAAVIARMLRREGSSALRNPLVWGMPLVLVVSVAVVAMSSEVFMKRFDRESKTITQLMEGDIENLEYSSIGVRIHTWRVALQWYRERPVLGWGGNADTFVIEETKTLPESLRKNIGHLHNSYIYMLVSYGIVGAAIFTGLLVWFVWGSWSAWRARVLPDDMAVFGLGFLVYWLIINCFESYITFWTGVYALAVVLGGFFTHYWRWRYGKGVYNQCEYSLS